MSRSMWSRCSSVADRVGRRLILGLALASLLLPLCAYADDVVTAVPSLKLVPQDAAFYGAMLRNREQVEMVAHSNAWKKLTQMDFYRQIQVNVKQALEQPGGPGPQIMPILELPENQQAAAVLREMFSDEVFSYGSADFTDTLKLGAELFNTMRFAPMFYELSGGGELNRSEYLARMLLNVANSDLERIKVPEVVVGFRVRSEEPAEEQLRRIEAYATVLLEQLPQLEPWRKKFKRTKVGGGQFLTLTLDGEQIPWDMIPFAQLAEKEGQYEKLRRKLRGLKVVVCLGLQKGYVVLTIGKSTEHLAGLGSAASLAEHPRLKMLRDKGAQRYTAVGFTSDRLARAVGLQPEDLDTWVDLADRLLPTTRLPAEDQRQIMADLRLAAIELKARIPTSRARLQFAYLAPRGIESYEADWTENAYLDGTQKLPVLEHVGAAPLLAVATRGRYRPQDYDLLVNWLVKGRGYFEKFAVPTMNEPEQIQYKQFAEIAYPLFSRLDNVHRKMLIPALSDGQLAVVLDGGLKSKRWLEAMPPTAEVTAVPMPALVLGVSDVALLEQAMGEYRSIANELIRKLRPLVRQRLPEFELPPAKVHKLADGQAVYYYPLPRELGVDKQLAPNAGVSAKFLILSGSPRLSVDLLKSQTLAAAASGPLADGNRPLAAAAVFDWPQLVDLALPWVNEGVRMYLRQSQRAFDFDKDGGENAKQPAAADDSDAAKKILVQVTEGAQLLKVFRGVTAITYLEDGARITHAEARFEDAP